jgi:hypothetical protein
MADFEEAQRDFLPLSIRDVKLQKSDVEWSDIGGQISCLFSLKYLIKFQGFTMFARFFVKPWNGQLNTLPSLPSVLCDFAQGTSLPLQIGALLTGR